MKYSTLVSSVTACFCLVLSATQLGAQTAATSTVNDLSPGEKNVSTVKPAEACLGELRAFDSQIEKDGYWMAGSGYGYGYPLGGLGDGYGDPLGGYPGTTETGYQDARPGYEVRILVASANILAQHGQQQSCDNVLATTRNIYKVYLDTMHSRGVAMVDMPSWRQHQIAAAQPVTSGNTSFRSDELLGTDVRNTKNEALGSVDDLVTSPQTGKIAYLMIARGGIFGIGETFVPVPWVNFKATAKVNLLVLDTTKEVMDAAPKVNKEQFTTSDFDQQSRKVDAYWNAHLSNKASN